MFVAKCNGCHGYPAIESISDDRWPDIMKRMAAKADLTETQERDVLHFILAQRGNARAEPATAASAHGSEIFFKDWGAGQAVVVHHGWPLSSRRLTSPQISRASTYQRW